MARVKRGVTARRRHKKIIAKARGYYNARRKVFRVAKQAVTKAAQYAYIGRKQRKRQFRALWIVRINAAARQYGLSYSRLINGLKKAGIGVFAYGNFLTILVNFVILAFIIFMMVKQINRLRHDEPPAPEPEAPPTPEDVILLREIRDSLKK